MIKMTLNKRNIFLLVLFTSMQWCGYAQKKFIQTGQATYYSDYFQGRRTASGERYDRALYTAAHPTLPFQTLVKITNLNNNKYVIVKINDRCPKHYSRVIDLSKAAAAKLDMITAGRVNITLEEITPADLNIISQKFENTDSIFKWKFPDSLSIKNLNNIKILYKSDLNERLYIINNFSITLQNRFMIKPKEIGNLTGIVKPGTISIVSHSIYS